MMRRSCVAVLCVAAACTSASKPAGDDASASAGASAQASEERGRLKLSLPAWASVALDGTPQQADASVEVTAGSHEVSVTTPCGVLTHEVQVGPGGTKTLRAVDVPGLAGARLQLEVKGKDGARLPATVTLRDGYGKQVEEGEGLVVDVPTHGGALEVPACRLRMTVRASKEAGLGGFVEDVELVDGETLKREVVLLPGPDLVRIAGGAYVAGPPPGQIEQYREEYEEYENEAHEVRTFDIDRHEVTAAQYEACVVAGGCAEDLEQLLKTTAPPRAHEKKCNSRRVIVDQRTIVRKIEPGRERHPVDCLAMWEAERYCIWAGKRLPTNVEWEYAARSRKTEYKWPWGNDESRCRAHGSSWRFDPQVCPKPEGTAEVCSYPDGNSEQGVCDFGGNVQEMLEFPRGHRRRGMMSVRGGGYSGIGEPFGISFDLSTQLEVEWRYRQQIAVGFRCARDVKGAGE